jgi:hypothetical protein
MSTAQVKLVVAKEAATAGKKETFGLHRNINWSKLMLKTMVLRAIDYNAIIGTLTAAQEAEMLSKITNLNIQ